MAHVVVTGASSGIGEALAREWARAGAHVTLVARRRELLEKLAAEVEKAGGRAHVVAADLSIPERATEWLAPAEAALGPVDILVNNAGVQIVAPTVSVDEPRGRALLALDLLSPLALTLAVLPGMIARRAGAIVDVSSMAALAPTPGMYHYNAAKGGLAAASESLRGELRKSGVHVVTVYPGPVDTAMARAGYEALPPTRLVRMLPEGTTDELARLVRRAVEKRKPRVIYPRAYALARYFPATTRWFLDAFTPTAKLPAERKAALPDKQ